MTATIGLMSSSKSSPLRFFIRWWTKIDFFLHLRLLLLFDIHFASLLYPIFTQTTYLLSCLPLLKQQTSLVLKSKLAFLEVKIHSEGMMFSHWDRACKSLTINIMMLYSNLPFYALFIKKTNTCTHSSKVTLPIFFCKNPGWSMVKEWYLRNKYFVTK